MRIILQLEGCSLIFVAPETAPPNVNNSLVAQGGFTSHAQRPHNSNRTSPTISQPPSHSLDTMEPPDGSPESTADYALGFGLDCALLLTTLSQIYLSGREIVRLTNPIP
jgi:hypothetical protein